MVDASNVGPLSSPFSLLLLIPLSLCDRFKLNISATISSCRDVQTGEIDYTVHYTILAASV